MKNADNQNFSVRLDYKENQMVTDMKGFLCHAYVLSFVSGNPWNQNL